MDKKLNELMEDLDKVLGLIKKISEATPEDVDSIKRDINLTREELKERYGKENTTETNSQEA